MARAIGEAAPLILVGAFTFVTFMPQPFAGVYTVLPIQVLDWATRPQEDFHGLAAAAIIVMLVLMLHPQRARPRHPCPPLTGHPVVEEDPLPSQLAEAPDEHSTGRVGPTIRIAAAEDRAGEARRAPNVRRRPSSSCVTCRSTTGRSGPSETWTSTIGASEITALIGPSGCGKTTLLRTLNRMNDLVPGFRTEGRVTLRRAGPLRQGAWTRSPSGGGSGWSSRSRTRSRSRSGTTSPSARRSMASRATLTSLVERSLRRAALWDDVKDKLKQSGMALSGGQQQRLCIARTIAVEPEVILMDEPCSALDPRSTLQIEELMAELKKDYTIVIVTHNMQQAARASDTTIFMTMGEDRAGFVVEQGDTIGIFTNPQNQLTEDYVSGRFG